MMIPIYTGYDYRESAGWHTFVASVMQHTSRAVAFTPLSGRSDGSNAFTQARFLVPRLQDYRGFALFADGCDMIALADIARLWDMRDDAYAVQVVQHDYRTRHPRKYVGTAMESPNIDYKRKNWASLMIMNCDHPAWRRLEDVFDVPGLDLLQLRFLRDAEIGELPRAWNWLADEYGENPEAQIVHWTAGIPAFPRYAEAPMADLWAAAALRARHLTE